jgi:hypothetical protein
MKPGTAFHISDALGRSKSKLCGIVGRAPLKTELFPILGAVTQVHFDQRLVRHARTLPSQMERPLAP